MCRYMATKKPSIKELRALCQATAPNPARESFVGRFSRIFSIYFTRLFISTRITPNQITVLSVIVFFVGIYFFFIGTVIANIIGALIIFFSIILDGCDGEIARYKKNGSVAGTLYVEPVSHDIQYGLMFPLLGVAVWQNGASAYFIVVGFLASLFKLWYRLIEMRFWTLTNNNATEQKIEEIKKEYKQKSIPVRLAYWVNKEIFSSTGIFLMILILGIVNRIDIYLWIYAGGYALFFSALFAKQIIHISSKKKVNTLKSPAVPLFLPQVPERDLIAPTRQNPLLR